MSPSPPPPGEGNTLNHRHPSRPDTPIPAGPGECASPAPALPSGSLAAQDAENPDTQHPELPAWDRTVDVVCHKDQHGHQQRQTELEAFTHGLKAFRRNEYPPPSRNGSRSASGSSSSSNSSSGLSHGSQRAGRKISYVNLPDNVRLRICHYLTAVDSDEDKQKHKHKHKNKHKYKQNIKHKNKHHRVITLSLGIFLRESWDPMTFTPITHALAPIQPYLSVSRDFRADMLVSFFTRETFHVVLSPYVNARLSPHATLWMFRYGVYMRRMVIEVDLSKLGGGIGDPAAVGGLLPTTRAFDRQIKMVSESQLRRDANSPIDELVLLCRRFYPVRPSQASDEKMTQSPDNRLRFCDSLMALSGHVSSLRMCGFSDDYTRRFVAKMFPDHQHRFAYRLAPSVGPWGRLPKQRILLLIDDGNGNVIPDDEYTSSEPPRPVEAFCARFERPVMPPPPAVDPETGDMSFPQYLHYRDDRGQSTRPKAYKGLLVKKTAGDEAANTTDASAVSGEMTASEKKRQFMKMLSQCLVNRDKRRFFSR